MHGSYAANMAMSNADLLIALGVRFDDRVTGRLAAFAPHAKVIHVDIDPAEIGKNRAPDVPIVGDVKRVLAKLNKLLAEDDSAAKGRSTARRAWWQQIREWRDQHPLQVVTSDTEIKPQHLMAEIDRLSKRPGDRDIRRGPAPDVGGAIDPLQRTAPVAELGRARFDGIRPAGGDRRAIRAARQAGLFAGGRRRVPDVDSGTGYGRQLRFAHQDRRA